MVLFPYQILDLKIRHTDTHIQILVTRIGTSGNPNINWCSPLMGVLTESGCEVLLCLTFFQLLSRSVQIMDLQHHGLSSIKAYLMLSCRCRFHYSCMALQSYHYCWTRDHQIGRDSNMVARWIQSPLKPLCLRVPVVLQPLHTLSSTLSFGKLIRL